MSKYNSDEDENVLIFPITDLEPSNGETSQSEVSKPGSNTNDGEADEEDTEIHPKPQMPLRERRLKRAYSLAKPEMKPIITGSSKSLAHKMAWMKAIDMAKKMEDPWAMFHIDSLEMERCKRYRYSALKKRWIMDRVLIRMEDKPFTNGAMRQCFRLKKHSTVCTQDCKNASNYVAKCYMEKVDRHVYFQDVKLQMNAKLWGEEYNRHNPPKKVDIFQMYVLEFNEREGSPLFHLEHFIEGNYIKYNSNSGFVEETCRLTPQAFSHFTFERSGHKLIVVDIQGVEDLYTDPQIHTDDGREYGDGNLGPKGMALFFHSHICNAICESLGLAPFDLSPSEMKHHEDFIRNQKQNAMTCVRGKEESVVSASPEEMVDLTILLGRRHSQNSQSSSNEGNENLFSHTSEDEPMSTDTASSGMHLGVRTGKRCTSESDASTSEIPLQSSSDEEKISKIHLQSSSNKEKISKDEERLKFSEDMQKAHRASCVNVELNTCPVSNVRIGASILGQIHHEMAKYHEIGRFSLGDRDDVDWDAALFHEEYAAKMGVLEAIDTMARLHLGMQRNVLVRCNVERNTVNINSGLDYMLLAADAGDCSAMIYIAKAFDTGDNLGTRRSRSWLDAIHWYEKAVKKMKQEVVGEESDSTMEDPLYVLLARQAEMYLDGGYGLERNPYTAGELFKEAADAATEAMKGRLATKYFMMAEAAWPHLEA